MQIHISERLFVQISGARGSNMGGFFRDKDSGQEAYIKYAEYSEENALKFKNELLAMKLYERFELKVPRGEYLQFEIEGISYCGLISYKENIQTLQAYQNQHQNFSENLNRFYKKVQKGFLVDCLLANWDVIGLQFDNLCVDQNDNPCRVDTGGALHFRAQGSRKDAAFAFDAPEFENMSGLRKGIAVQAASVFETIMNDAHVLSVARHHLLKLSSSLMRECIEQYGVDYECSSLTDNLYEKLESRRQNLLLKVENRMRLLKPLNTQEDYFNSIISDYLFSRASLNDSSYPLSYPNVLCDGFEIQRVKHGGMHAARVALYGRELMSVIKPDSSEKERFLLQLIALFHDSGRELDSGNDCEHWEQKGANQCIEFIRKNFGTLCTEEEIGMLWRAIVYKDNPQEQAQNIYALVLAAADSLDWVRSHSSDFNASYMPQLIQTQFQKECLERLAVVAKKFAVAQGDSPRKSFGVMGCFDMSIKKTYEHAPEGCYSAVQRLWCEFLPEFKACLVPERAQEPLQNDDISQNDDILQDEQSVGPVLILNSNVVLKEEVVQAHPTVVYLIHGLLELESLIRDQHFQQINAEQKRALEALSLYFEESTSKLIQHGTEQDLNRLMRAISEIKEQGLIAIDRASNNFFKEHWTYSMARFFRNIVVFLYRLFGSLEKNYIRSPYEQWTIFSTHAKRCFEEQSVSDDLQEMSADLT